MFERAAALGIDGIEVDGADLEARVPDIDAAAAQTGIRVAAVHFGWQGAILSPDVAERERALKLLRSNIACAVDLNALGVVWVPHYGANIMPDLSPWMSPGQMQAEMLHQHLRTLSDFSHALGVKLFIQNAPADETAFITDLDQAGAVVKRIKHPDVLIALNLGAGADNGTLPTLAPQIGYVSLPMEAEATALSALRATDYNGWITLSGAAPLPDAPIRTTLAAVRQAFGA